LRAWIRDVKFCTDESLKEKWATATVESWS
jgi:hypothetical protein